MAKMNQRQANYRPGNRNQCCGLCQYFEGAAHGTCTKVTGKISPFMISDVYKAAPNPTGLTYPADTQVEMGGGRLPRPAGGAPGGY